MNSIADRVKACINVFCFLYLVFQNMHSRPIVSLFWNGTWKVSHILTEYSQSHE